ncbi:zinc finger, CCHC-type containing protein [Tanacetum coccineum]|uniref:Zinc finger, CCHC-type containing protein n=1 Tax=Tanacetum coccineum TaxID=301880 RepID=A0ABQ5IT59_9ASTR
MVEHNNSSRYNDNKGKRKHHDNTKVDPNKKSKATCWKCGKPGHLKNDYKGGKFGNKANGSGTHGSVDGSTNSLKRATVHVCKDRCWFKTYESLNDGSILHIGNESIALVHGRGCVDLMFSSGKIVSWLNIVNDNIASAFMSTSKLNDSILWHARLSHVYFKRMQDMFKDGLILTFDIDIEKCKTCMLNKITKKPFQNVKRETKVLELIHSDLCDLHATPSLGNKKYFVTFIDDSSRFCYAYLLHSKDEALDKFKVFKTDVELQQGSQIKRFRIDRGGEYMDTLYFQSVGIIHETTAPYTPQQNGISERKNRVPKEMVNFMLSYSGLSQGFWGEAMAVVRLPDPKLKTLGKRGIECIFIRYAKHSKAFRFYVIKPNESVSINLITELRDAIFDENIFYSVPRPSLKIPNGTEDIGGLVVLKEVTEEVVTQQPEPKLSKGKRNRTPKNFGPEFQLYLIKGTMDEVFDQHSYCFNVEDDPKTFDEAMKSQDVAFWKEAINDYMDSIMGNNTWLLADLPPCYKPLAFLNGDLDEEVDLTKEFLSSRFSIKDMGEADVILGIRIKHESNGIAISQSYYIEKVLKKLNYFDCTPVSTPMDTSEKLMPNNGQAVSQLEYSRVIGCLMYAMNYTMPDIAFIVGKLSTYTSNPGTQHWQAIQQASKKQTCITGSIMESKFMALVAVGKEVEWLKNLFLKIPLWSKPIAPISIRYDSSATLAKAYSQMYNGKSRHLGIRHSMIRELITNGVISIEFMRSQQNLADHLMKGLARDMVIKYTEGMGLNSNSVVEC